jgi:hypothetical protein
VRKVIQNLPFWTEFEDPFPIPNLQRVPNYTCKLLPKEASDLCLGIWFTRIDFTIVQGATLQHATMTTACCAVLPR